MSRDEEDFDWNDEDIESLAYILDSIFTSSGKYCLYSAWEKELRDYEEKVKFICRA